MCAKWICIVLFSPCRLQQSLQVTARLSEEDWRVTHLQSDVGGVRVQRTGTAERRCTSAAETSRLYSVAAGQDRAVQGGPVGQGGWTAWVGAVPYSVCNMEFWFWVCVVYRIICDFVQRRGQQIVFKYQFSWGIFPWTPQGTLPLHSNRGLN